MDPIKKAFCFVALGLFVATAIRPAVAEDHIRITTWNLEWFPNGHAKDASLEEQARRIADAAAVLRPLHPDILLLQEVRDYDARMKLGEAIEAGKYKVAICSAFKEPFQRGLGHQQVAILAKFDAQAAWAEPWKSREGIDPPRGFAFAWFKTKSAEIGVYSLHLKSNLVRKTDKSAELAKDIRKREVAMEQLTIHVRDVTNQLMPSIKALVVGGDFNTNTDQSMFQGERTLAVLVQAGFQNCFGAIPLSERITHPANHGYPDATFDYLFGRNIEESKPIIAATRVSDHYPVTADFSLR